MKILKYIQLFALCVVVPALASCDDDDDNVAAYVPRTAVGTELVAAGSIPRVYADTSFVVAMGVTETDLTVQKWDSRPLRMFVIDIDLNQPWRIGRGGHAL